MTGVSTIFYGINPGEGHDGKYLNSTGNIKNDPGFEKFCNIAKQYYAEVYSEDKGESTYFLPYESYALVIRVRTAFTKASGENRYRPRVEVHVISNPEVDRFEYYLSLPTLKEEIPGDLPIRTVNKIEKKSGGKFINLLINNLFNNKKLIVKIPGGIEGDAAIKDIVQDLYHLPDFYKKNLKFSINIPKFSKRSDFATIEQSRLDFNDKDITISKYEEKSEKEQNFSFNEFFKYTQSINFDAVSFSKDFTVKNCLHFDCFCRTLIYFSDESNKVFPDCFKVIWCNINLESVCYFIDKELTSITKHLTSKLYLLGFENIVTIDDNNIFNKNINESFKLIYLFSKIFANSPKSKLEEILKKLIPYPAVDFEFINELKDNEDLKNIAIKKISDDYKKITKWEESAITSLYKFSEQGYPDKLKLGGDFIQKVQNCKNETIKDPYFYLNPNKFIVDFGEVIEVLKNNERKRLVNYENLKDFIDEKNSTEKNSTENVLRHLSSIELFEYACVHIVDEKDWGKILTGKNCENVSTNDTGFESSVKDENKIAIQNVLKNHRKVIGEDKIFKIATLFKIKVKTPLTDWKNILKYPYNVDLEISLPLISLYNEVINNILNMANDKNNNTSESPKLLKFLASFIVILFPFLFIINIGLFYYTYKEHKNQNDKLEKIKTTQVIEDDKLFMRIIRNEPQTLLTINPEIPIDSTDLVDSCLNSYIEKYKDRFKCLESPKDKLEKFKKHNKNNMSDSKIMKLEIPEKGFCP